MNKNAIRGAISLDNYHRILKIMKITAFFLFLGIFFAYAETGHSQGVKLTLNLRSATIREVCKQIEKQSDYIFVFSDNAENELNKKVNISTNSENIEEILNDVFSSTGLTYKILDKQVVVYHDNEKKSEVVVAPSPTPQPEQTKTITGKVTDSSGEPLPGATVVVKGTTIGTVTDADGNYSLSNVPPDATLVFSFVGMQAQEIKIGNQTKINVEMQEESVALEEVVAVGYGTQKKISVTGSISSIQTKEIKQSPASNLAVSLAGRLPGLTAIQRSGEPGRELTQLYIRGASTFNTQAPIILVDGVERDLTFIDPTEVESITILKDASSTAIFGTRGANGVILVTTRRGVTEKPEISFTAEFTAQDFTRKAKPVNSFDYALLRNLSLTNDGLPYEFTAEEIDKFRTGVDPIAYPNTDWYKIIYKDFAPQQRYNLNVSGAGKMMKYFVNVGYISQDGQFKTEKNLPYDPSFKLDRYNFRSNIDMQLNNSLKSYLNIAGYLEDINSPVGGYNQGVSLGNISSQSPSIWLMRELANFNATIYGPLTPDGNVITSANNHMPPYGELNRSGFIRRSVSNVQATYGMEQLLDFITKGLSAKVNVSYDTRLESNTFHRKKYPKFVQMRTSDGVEYRPYNDDEDTPLAITGFRSYSYVLNLQGSLNYSNKFNKHSVDGLLLFQKYRTIINEELPYNLIGTSARISYNYDNKYLLEVNTGYNGSEQFAKDNRFGFFPAISAGWVISQENFYTIKDIIDYFKIRGSYGKVGNDRIGGRRFLYLDNIQLGTGGIPSLGRGGIININSLKNQNLQWEVAQKGNIGLELTFLHDFSMIFDLFKERRNNILINRGTVPSLIGLPSATLPPANIGIVDNKGYEFELNYRKRYNNDFSIISKLNINYAKNKVIFADEPKLPEEYAYSYRTTGYPLGQHWGYIVEDYFKNEEDIANSPIQSVAGHPSRPGDLKYKNLNNDNAIDDKDIAPIGKSSIPEYTFGYALSATYKNFDVSLLFQGVTGVSSFLYNIYFFPTNNFYDIHLNSWTAERAANNERITFPRLTTQSNPNQNQNTFTIRDGSYLRLKNVEIGYSLPLKISKLIGANRARLYLNGFNLFTWDKLPTKNFDPEYSYWFSEEGFSYPPVRLLNLGINVTF